MITFHCAVAMALAFAACVPSIELHPGSARRSPSSEIKLSRISVPEWFHIDGPAQEARFIRDTTTGSFEILPGREVEAGTRLALRGEGCRDARSVYVVLYRWKAGQHDRDQTWLDTLRFPATPNGWRGNLRLPRRPKRENYGVTAACELGGHAYFANSWDVYVGGGRSSRSHHSH